MAKKILLILLAVMAALFLARGAIAKMAVTAGVKALTGMKLEMRGLSVGLFRSQVHVTGMKLHNPPGFPDPLLADVPELYVDADLPALLRGRVHLRELRLDLNEVTVVKNRAGVTNIDSLTAVKKAKEEQAAGRPAAAEPGKPASFKVDKLKLKVGRVVYKDYSRGEPPTVREFSANIDDQYVNVTNATSMVSLIVARTLIKTTVADLAHLDLGALQERGFQALGLPAGLIGGAVKQMGKAGGEVVEGAGDLLRGVLNAEKEKQEQEAAQQQ